MTGEMTGDDTQSGSGGGSEDGATGSPRQSGSRTVSREWALRIVQEAQAGGAGETGRAGLRHQVATNLVSVSISAARSGRSASPIPS